MIFKLRMFLLSHTFTERISAQMKQIIMETVVLVFYLILQKATVIPYNHYCTPHHVAPMPDSWNQAMEAAT